MWQQWTNAFLGLAVIIVPFLGFVGEALVWTLAGLGMAITAIAVWGAVAQEGTYETFNERMT